MLILTRRVGEQIVIADNIIVAILGVKGNQVRLGINAPKEVSVHREEIHQRIQAEKTAKENAESLIELNIDSVKALVKVIKPKRSLKSAANA